MDWNRDGKVDANDGAIYHEVINKETSNSSSNNNGSLNSAHSYNSVNSNNSRCTVEITKLGQGVLAIVAIIHILMFIEGAGANALVNMIEIGLIVFLAAQWLDS